MSIAIQNPEISWEYSPSLIRMLGFIMSEWKIGDTHTLLQMHSAVFCEWLTSESGRS